MLFGRVGSAGREINPVMVGFCVDLWKVYILSQTKSKVLEGKHVRCVDSGSQGVKVKSKLSFANTFCNVSSVVHASSGGCTSQTGLMAALV